MRFAAQHLGLSGARGAMRFAGFDSLRPAREKIMTEKVVLTFTDTETTGLIDIQPDAEITEIAIVSWCDGEQTVELHERVRPRKIKPEPHYNKSYNEQDWAKADSWDVHASTAISELLRGKYICGSNPDFDKRMIAAECFRSGQPAPRWHHRGVNTSTLGFPLYITGQVAQTGLEHLAKFFGIEHAAHTALGDCYAAIKVWEAFYDLYVYRPKMMKEALEHIEHNWGADHRVRDVALKGLVGE